MNRDRLDFSLEQTTSGQWELFEQFASTFLSTEFPSLRTVAAPSGDGGRDAELFSPSGNPSVVLQYSVTGDWPTKIRLTARRLRELGNDASVLVYATNQVIGAKADRLKDELGKDHGLHLDIRDRSYFLDRLDLNDQTREAADRLARFTADPILEARGLAARTTSPLDSDETQAALLFLALQWEDEQRQKSLTKVGYEGLVRSALTGTDSANRLTREQVHVAVGGLVPNHSPEVIAPNVDRALKSLNKRAIRYWIKEDEFCLTFQENTRLVDLQAELAIGDAALSEELRNRLGVADFDLTDDQQSVVLDTTLRLIEYLLSARGEAFASAVVRDDFDHVVFDSLSVEFTGFVEENSLDWPQSKLSTSQFFNLVQDLLAEPGDEVRRHLRSLSNAYTLFAFLRETDDVQKVLSKIAGYGELWLDTSVLLPVFADVAFEKPGRFTRLLVGARTAGMSLFVTPGVLEEISSHMDRCLAFCNAGIAEWRGDTPFLIAEYVRSGRALSQFRSWLEQFRGSLAPEDDIADYIEESVGVRKGDLEPSVEALDRGVRLAIERVWDEIHRRRSRDRDFDSHVAMRMARHDVMNYAGVIGKRSDSVRSPLGYLEWWLTVDRGAFTVRDRLKSELGRDTPDNPVISVDFLTHLLLFGPARTKVSAEAEKAFPVVVDAGLVEYLTPEILQAAEEVREKHADLPQRVRARHVRDHLDRNRWRYGRLAKAGLDQIEIFE